MYCILCKKRITEEEDYYELCARCGGCVICRDCFDKSVKYKQCIECGCVDTSENIYEGLCEDCLEYHEILEEMVDHGSEKEYM